jgi:hypothetical protein
MGIHCYTSISFSYLCKARVLAWSLKRFHPDWVFTVVITDREPAGYIFNLDEEPFDRVLWSDELPFDNVRGWLFKHDVVEACTAVKGPVIRQLTQEAGVEKIFYLDPDIAVFNPLDDLVARLDAGSSILLTPHQVTPETDEVAVMDNEICSLGHGVYNLGFIGVNNDAAGRAFAAWWSDRLSKYCYDDLPRGLFVDQKWCDIVPALFDGVDIVKDPGCNVASWNLSQRTFSIDPAGQIRVNGHPLRFYHFTKLGPVGDVMTERYAQDNVEVYEIWAWYKRMIKRFDEPRIPKGYWYYGQFENGEKIPRQARLLYRDRPDLQAQFPDPYREAFYAWLENEVA